MVDLQKRSLIGGMLLTPLALPIAARAGASTMPAPEPYHLPMASGPFRPTPESLKKYQTPDWFRDAKFGIWSHWGPQSVPRAGDWYARQMYIYGHPQYEHHLKTYGRWAFVELKDVYTMQADLAGKVTAEVDSRYSPCSERSRTNALRNASSGTTSA